MSGRNPRPRPPAESPASWPVCAAGSAGTESAWGGETPVNDGHPGFGSDDERHALGLRLLREVDATAFQFLDLQFTDVTGALKSVVLPANQFRETVEYGHW